MFLTASPALAQDESGLVAAETSNIVPLIKMTKPELKVVFIKQPMDTFEDEVIAHGTKFGSGIKGSNPIICKDLVVTEMGGYTNGTRLRKTKKYCNHRVQWDMKQRRVDRAVKDATKL